MLTALMLKVLMLHLGILIELMLEGLLLTVLMIKPLTSMVRWLTLLMLTLRLMCILSSVFRSLLQEAPPHAPLPVMMSSTPMNQPANHLPELHHPHHHPLLQHTHRSWVSTHTHKQKVQKEVKIITSRSKPFYQLNNMFPTGRKTADFRCTRRHLILLGFRGQKYWIFCEKSKIICIVMNSTDGEIAERENNMKKVLKEKGKRLNGSESRWFHSNSYVSGGVWTLVFQIFYLWTHTDSLWVNIPYSCLLFDLSSLLM